MAQQNRLGIGFIGSGFITKFHIQSMVGVRDADVRAVWSPNPAHAAAATALAHKLEVGAATTHTSIESMVADPAVDAICAVTRTGRIDVRGAPGAVSK